MFTLLKPYLIALVFFTVSGLGLTTYYYQHQYEQEMVVSSALQAKVTEYEEAVEADKANQAIVSKENTVTGQKFLDSKRAVESFKGREAVLRAKPELTEKMINRSFNKFSDEISCTTGDTTPCK